MSGAWQQLEQLLTCAICMDRFKNPKLLPCQHTYCGDPCMEGLVDYARRQIKCPECRAEHRIPYNGIQTLPTNVTLMRFLELHRTITGEEPEPEEAMLGRCSVCSEKQHLVVCHHCAKKICSDCKEAHLDVMRREIARICSNVRRSLTRLEDTLKETKRNEDKLITNCANVREEIIDVISRSIKDLEKLKERLTGEVDSYEESESSTLSKLSEDLEQEFSTITANCDVVEKYIDEDHDWTDAELVEYKEIFVKTLEFLRNFDADTTDYGRKVRLNVLTDTEQVHKILSGGLLEIKIQPSSSINQSLAPPGQTLSNALMRSQSDHRLASQFKKVDSRSMLDISSQRDGASDNEERGQGKSDILRRYGLLGDEDGHASSRHGGYKSKYVRDLLQEQENMMRPQTAISCRFEDEKMKEPESLPKVFDVDGAVRAPLSGIVKIDDSGKFMERVFETKKKAKTRKEEKENLKKMQQQQQQLTQMAQQRMQQQMAAMRAQQQVSQQQQQQAQQSQAGPEPSLDSTANSTTNLVVATTAGSDTRDDRSKETPLATVAPQASSYMDEPSRYSSAVSRNTANLTDDDRGSDTGSVRSRRTYLDDNHRTSSRDSPLSTRPVTPAKSSVAADEDRSSYRSASLGDYPSRTSSALTSRRQSYGSRQSSRVPESESDSDSEESEAQTQSNSASSRRYDESSAVAALLSRSQEARKSMSMADNASRDLRHQPQQNRHRNRSSSFQRSRSSGHILGASTVNNNNNSDDDVSDSEQERNVSSRRNYYSRGPDSTVTSGGISGSGGGGGGYGNPRSAYLQKGDCKLSLGRRGAEAGCFTWPRSVAVGPDGSLVVADSSNHRVQVFDSNGRFLQAFGKQGSGDGELDNPAGLAVNRIGQIIVSDRYNNRVQIFDSTGRFIRAFGGDGRTDGKFQCPWGLTTDSLGFIYVCDKENHRVQVFQSDGSFVGKMGSVGSRPGCLEHPSYIAVSSTNRVIVSDTNNHRVQVFDVNGRCQFTFGSEGSEEGLFRFPRGVAVDDQGYIVVADSGNNRIQIFQPDGSFIKAFGTWGSEAGKFKGLEDIAVNSKGDIVACDRENHRIQVF